MLKMVDGTGIIGVDMVCPLGGAVSPPQPPNYDKVEVEGVGSLMLANSLKAPLERLELIGNSVQGENPAPDNPQEIKSAGKYDEASGKYLIDVKVTGKNIFNKNAVKQGYEFGAMLSDVETAKQGWFVSDFMPVKATTYQISGKKTGSGCKLYSKDKVFVKNIQAPFGGIKFDEGIAYFRINGEIKDLDKVQVEEGNQTTDYEPYQESQTLTLTSDHPITKWDKLVEQGGEYGWLYGGKIIDSYNSEPIDTEYMSSTGQLSIGATVLYRLKEPEFIPLSESEQTQLRSLHSYNGTTNITVDSGEVPCGIKLTYRKEK